MASERKSGKTVQEYIDETPRWAALLTAFLFPVLLHDVGIATILYVLIGTCLLGAYVTWRFGIETMGVNLENIGRINARGHDGPGAPFRLEEHPAAGTAGGP